MVQEETASRVRFNQWPASTVNHQTFLVFGRVNIPEFFNANAVVLRIFTGIQLEVSNQLLAQVAAAAFGKYGGS